MPSVAFWCSGEAAHRHHWGNAGFRGAGGVVDSDGLVSGRAGQLGTGYRLPRHLRIGIDG